MLVRNRGVVATAASRCVRRSVTELDAAAAADVVAVVPTVAGVATTGTATGVLPGNLHGNLHVDHLLRGPADGPVVILLHGFPQTNASWAPVMDRLVAAGYRCVAPNLRGYSPGARPKGRRHYRASLLAGDANPDLLRLITTDAGPLITTASEILHQALADSTWLNMSYDDAERIARTLTRMALSYVAMPPEGDRDVAADLAAIIGPAIESARA